MLTSKLSRKLSSLKFLNIGPFEEDEGFKSLLREIAQKGLFLYGVLGIFISCTYILSYTIFAGQDISWSIGSLKGDEMLIYDKVFLIMLCLIMLLFSRVLVSLKFIRIFVFFISWIGSFLMIIEDISTLDFSFSTPYTTLSLFFAVAIVPYKGWQTVGISFVLITSNLLVIYAAPGFIEGSFQAPKPSQFIYLFAMCLLVISMSSQIYINRYRQYKARKEAESLSEELEHQKERILENEKLKERFFTNVNHELRTPLTMILGPLVDFEIENKGKKTINVGTDFIKVMRKNAQRLLNLINQLLDLAKIESLDVHLNLERVDLAEVIQDTVDDFYPLAKTKNITLSTNLIGYDFKIYSDRNQLQRALGNLISNAIKYSSDNKVVEVTIKEKLTSQNGVVIKIRDNGLGIPPDDLPHIFDRFYMGTQTSFKNEMGSGIGLALVKEIIQLHNGNIGVQSRVGEGTEFIINLPENKPSREYDSDNKISSLEEHPNYSDLDEVSQLNYSAIQPNQDSVKLPDTAATVLLVDDNPDIINYLTPKLSSKYHVLTEGQGDKALDVLKEYNVDLVISDVMMPGMDGYELCESIKKDRKLNHIPVILLTARASEESRIEGLEQGADDYIMKPFSAAELMIRAENLIEIRKKLQEKFSEQVYLKGKKIEVKSEDARLLKQIQTSLDKHIGNSNFGVEWLADDVNLSKRHLHRKVQDITGMSVGGYIRMYRLERAGNLLSQNWGNVNEIAYAVGFKNPKYFSRLFKQTFGVTPTEFGSNQSMQ